MVSVANHLKQIQTKLTNLVFESFQFEEQGLYLYVSVLEDSSKL